MEIIAIPVAILVVVLLWMVSVTNRFTRLAALVRESWSDIDVSLKRRHDLIPNLVETVKGYAAHEKELFERVARAREAARGSVQSESELAQAVNQLLMRAEAYPELKSSANFLQLQRELIDTEDRIAAARRFFNANVRDYNILIESFPSSILKGDRKPKDFYEVDSIVVRQSPQIDLGQTTQAR